MVSRVEMIKWIRTKRLSMKNTLSERARLTSAALIPVDAEPFPRTIVAIPTLLVVDH